MLDASTPGVNISLYQAASALNANSRWQEVISENLSAGNVPGYKRQEMAYSDIQAGMMNIGKPGGNITRQPVVMPTARSSTVFTEGSLRRTGVATDVAIEGGGFFEVQLPDGSMGYTRDGEFQMGSQGQLVTKQGFPVMGQGGPIQLDRNNLGGALSIAANGTVSQGSTQRGQLKVVDFNNPSLLTPSGGGIFVAQDQGVSPSDKTDAIMRQGFLEDSNTSTTREMANLITVMRSSEANMKVIQMQDERMGRTISELGSPN